MTLSTMKGWFQPTRLFRADEGGLILSSGPINSIRPGYACCVLFLCLSFCLSSIGQTASTGALTGTVTDPTGALVPNATVALTSAATGQTRTAATGTDGSYRFVLLPPGTYSAKFDATGFKSSEINGINVNVTETPVLNEKLEVGIMTQEVDVQGNAEAVQLATSTVGTVVGGTTITDIPLSTRNFTNLLGLSAGANQDVNNATGLGKGTQPISVNGGAESNNTYQMDGAVVNNFASNGDVESGTNAAFGIPNPDAIQEFKIQTSLYDASYGRNSGANVNVVTKSGTNQFHGTLFEFFRNTALDANDWFNKYSQLSQGQPNKQQVFNQNQFGYSFGGPAKRDKLFFFSSYQQTEQKNGASPYGFSSGVILPQLPTGDRSNASFQQALGANYCHQPTFGKIIGLGGVQVACDGSNINPVALKLLNLKLANGNYYIPGATSSGPVTFSIPAIYKEYQGIANGDWLISQKNTLAIRYFTETDPTTAPFSCGLGFPSNCVPGAPVFLEYGNQAANLKLTTVVSANLINEARVSYQRTTVINNEQSSFTSSQVGIQPIQTDVDQLTNLWFLPVGGSVQMDLGAHPFFFQKEAVNEYQLADQVSWIHGRHSVRSGFDLEKDQWNYTDPGLSIGYTLFGSFPDFLVGLGSCAPGSFPFNCNSGNPGASNGTPLSNILSQINSNTRQQPGGTYHGYRSPAYDAFVQDDVKVTPQLTLNLGFRWQYYPPLTDNTSHMTNLWISQIQKEPIPGTSPATGSFAGYVVPSNYNGPALPAGVLKLGNKSVTSQPWHYFAPRVGFAWQPVPGNSRIVFRGGSGLFNDRVSGFSYISAVQQETPYAFTVPFNSTASLARPYDQTPLGWNAPRWVDFSTGASSNISSPLLAQNMLTPQVWTYNLQTQWEFLPEWVLELGYVGSRGIHLLIGNYDLPNIARIATPTNPINGVTTSTSSNASLRGPLLGIANVDTMTDNRGDTHYNGLQATVRRQLSHGLSLSAAYTWSNTVSTGGGDNNHNIVPDFDNPGQLLYQKLYRPQSFKFFYSYELPYKQHPGVMGMALGGWNLSGTTVIQAGLPLSIVDSTGGTVYFGQSSNLSRAQYCPGAGPADVPTTGGLYSKVRSGLAGGNGYINSQAFCAVPNLGPGNTLSGNSGLGIIDGPRQDNWDISLARQMTLPKEKGAVLFRAEFFNAFNHPQFANPSTDYSGGHGTLGEITSSSVNPRIMQFALKYIF